MKKAIMVAAALLASMTATAAQATILLFKSYENGVLRGAAAWDTNNAGSTQSNAAQRPAVGFGDSGAFNSSNFPAFYLGGGGGGLGYGTYTGEITPATVNQQLWTNPTNGQQNIAEFAPGTHQLLRADGSVYRTIEISDITGRSMILYGFESPGEGRAFFIFENDPSQFVANANGGFTVMAEGASRYDGQTVAISSVTFNASATAQQLNTGLNELAIQFAGSNMYGARQFSGTSAAPAFLITGNASNPANALFQRQPFQRGSQGYDDYIYSIQLSSAAVAGVPEPATWTMMMLGFGALGAMIRRRPNRISARIRFS